ncbi:MAG TPA: VWA domain-containing protein [Terriglobales bacterium]|nr:VWA domain-containing protein [Terriglobales bacterium]
MKFIRCRPWMLGLALILGAGPAGVAQNPTASNAVPAATFHAETHQVVLDVVIVDHGGHFVPGLKPADFTILEDGKPQKVVGFAVHQASAAPPSPAPKYKLPPNQYTNYQIADPQRPITVVLMDVLNTQVQDQAYTRKQMIEFLKALPPGQRVALFALGTRLRMIQGFTGDSDTLVAAAKTLLRKTSPLMTSEQERQDSEILVSNLAANAGPGGGVSIPLEEAIHVALLSEQNYQQTDRMEFTLSALQSLARALSAYPGRKNLLWLSTEFPIRFGTNFVPTNNASQQAQAGLDNNDTRVRNLKVQSPPIKETAALLTASQIAVYPIDVRGTISPGTGIDISEQDQYGSMERIGNTRAQATARQTTMEWDDHEAMNDIARETGGKSFYGSNDIKAALSASMNEGENYYTLAYTPDNHNWDGKYRKLEVKTTQGGAKLTYRRGYYAVANPDAIKGKAVDDQIALLFATAMHPEAPTSTMVLLKVQVLPPDATHKTVRIDYAIDPQDVSFVDTPDKQKHVAIDLMAVAWNKDGKSVGESSDKIDTSVSLGSYENAMRSYIPAHQELEVKPGKYTLRLGVVDRNSRRIGTVDVPLTVTAEQALAR